LFAKLAGAYSAPRDLRNDKETYKYSMSTAILAHAVKVIIIHDTIVTHQQLLGMTSRRLSLWSWGVHPGLG